MAREAYVVIGSNFGDEGKGKMTNKFCMELLKRHSKVLNVRFNGGAQAGHNVSVNGKEHVFHIVGSGSLLNTPEKVVVDTYYTKHVILNSVIDNYSAFEKEGNTLGTLWAHENCMVTTVWDMTLNRDLERSRGNNRHGSCGCGIFETIKRNKEIALTLGMLHSYGRDLKSLLVDIVEYYKRACAEYGIAYDKSLATDECINEQMGILLDNFKGRFILVTKEIEHKVLSCYDAYVFEGAQGLLLDQNNVEYAPHLTPSNTGVKNVIELLNDNALALDSLQVCYVTRSFMTRHGAGRIDHEDVTGELQALNKNDTNITNEFQGSLRYGELDLKSLVGRVINDFRQCSDLNGQINVEIALAINHLDLTKDKLVTNNGWVGIEKCGALFDTFDKIYVGYGKNEGDYS